VKQPFSGSQSPDDARVAATHKAKREVLEKAGTYLQTLTIVEKGRLTKDQVVALASGILKTEIISQKHYTTKEGFGIIIKARVKVDTSILEERVKKLMGDRTAMEQLTAVRKREKELLDKIESLEEKQLLVKIERLKEKHSGSGKTRTTQIREKEVRKGFREATKALDAVALNDQVMDLVKNGKYSNPRKAIELLNKAIELDPGNAYAYGNRGLVYATSINKPKPFRTLIWP
jgi:tetratricopeptide (TPR) repeat protein